MDGSHPEPEALCRQGRPRGAFVRSNTPRNVKPVSRPVNFDKG